MTATATNKPAPPATRIAFLPSAGYGMPRATLHKFIEIRETHLLDKHGRPIENGEAYEYIYVCTETGTERRWGIANRFTPRWAKSGN